MIQDYWLILTVTVTRKGIDISANEVLISINATYVYFSLLPLGRARIYFSQALATYTLNVNLTVASVHIKNIFPFAFIRNHLISSETTGYFDQTVYFF